MPPKVILNIATSLDGFIARKDGSVDWLPKIENSEDYGLKEFIDSVDTVVLGNTTYSQYGANYPNKKCFVFSRKNTGREKNVTFVNNNVTQFLYDLNKVEKIWLVGGAEIIKEFLKDNLIDEFIITVIPTILGEGIPLFAKESGEHKLKLQNIKSFDSGVVQLSYLPIL